MPRTPKRDSSANRIIEKRVAQIDARITGAPAADTIATGFPSLDRVLAGGLRRSDLVVLAGDVGSGKSALALGIALRTATAGVPTLYLSGDTSPERLAER
ncbi:MAG TPA: DnaB-like helicase C-terminal domain-containing protein, partial [Gemmatimonadales bacterium]